jgi:tetratricopeptide (TPR) repeat protein
MLKRLQTYLRSQSNKIIIFYLLISMEAFSSQRFRPMEKDLCSSYQDDSAINLTEDNPDDWEFEEAAYYFNINDFEKSLELYLDIDRKAALNPKSNPAPKLNVANVYYEMDRLLEARLYYEAALYDSQLKELKPGERKDFITYINRHISEINEGLGRP